MLIRNWPTGCPHSRNWLPAETFALESLGNLPELVFRFGSVPANRWFELRSHGEPHRAQQGGVTGRPTLQTTVCPAPPVVLTREGRL